MHPTPAVRWSALTQENLRLSWVGVLVSANSVNLLTIGVGGGCAPWCIFLWGASS